MILEVKRGMDLFSKFKQNAKVIILDPHSSETPAYKPEERVAVILSPSLYWVKKLSISVKYLRDLKKLLPSIFEEILPDGNYSYTAYKEGDEYFAFAYKDREIIDLLKARGIPLGNVASIHFAQSELQHLQKPYRLNSKEAIYVQNGVVVLAPLEWFESTENLDVNNIALSNKTIQLQQFNHIVDNKSLYKLASLMLFFIVILGVEIFITKTKINSLESKKSSIFHEYNLKSTMIQNRSILQKYEKIDKEQRSLRKYTALFLKMKLKNGESLKLLEYKNKRLHAVFEGVDKTRVSLLTRELAKQSKAINIKQNGTTLDVEVKL